MALVYDEYSGPKMLHEHMGPQPTPSATKPADKFCGIEARRRLVNGHSIAIAVMEFLTSAKRRVKSLIHNVNLDMNFYF